MMIEIARPLVVQGSNIGADREFRLTSKHLGGVPGGGGRRVRLRMAGGEESVM